MACRFDTTGDGSARCNDTPAVNHPSPPMLFSICWLAKTRAHRHKLLQGGNCRRRGPPKHAHKVRVERHSSTVLFSRHWQSIIGRHLLQIWAYPFQKTSAHTQAIIGRKSPQKWAPQACTHAQFERKGVTPRRPIQDTGMHTHMLSINELLDFTCCTFGLRPTSPILYPKHA